MNLYYDTKTKTATHIESDTTILSTDDRVKVFFKPLEDEKELSFDDNNLPFIKDIIVSLDDIRTTKTKEINKACESSILSGFKSSSLGAEHSYESSKEDQLNLSGMKDRGTTLPLKCSSDNGTSWEWLLHTQDQLKTVFDDGVDFKLSQLQKSAMLKDQIKQATTLEALESITWEGV